MIAAPVSRNIPLTFDESAEGFGAPPDQSEKMRDLVWSLFTASTSNDPLQVLEDCIVAINTLQGDAYSDVLSAAFDLETPGSDFEKLRDFFHLAAEFGEMRLLGRVMANIHTVVHDRQQSEGLAGSTVAGNA